MDCEPREKLRSTGPTWTGSTGGARHGGERPERQPKQSSGVWEALTSSGTRRGGDGELTPRVNGVGAGARRLGDGDGGGGGRCGIRERGSGGRTSMRTHGIDFEGTCSAEEGVSSAGDSANAKKGSGGASSSEMEKTRAMMALRVREWSMRG
ncbi:uncharacterized protein LOC133917995 [Phragmites australis]|uniref:uncharacterized protein LOC133917995 n=1 Tax=Phragmites australis TaxID=29695 RepID=UPI002D78EE34|nr:uncharacterized protein LOC133917995 [Phragmites australis]